MKDLASLLNLPLLKYKETGNQVTYNNSGHGRPIIQRWLRSLPMFLSPKTGEDEKNYEALVIVDPLFELRNQQEMMAIMECISFLSDNGFKIYVPNKDASEFVQWQDIYSYGVANLRIKDGALLSITDDEIIQSSLDLRGIPRSKIGFLRTQDISLIYATAHDRSAQSDELRIALGNKMSNKRLKDENITMNLIVKHLRRHFSGEIVYSLSWEEIVEDGIEGDTIHEDWPKLEIKCSSITLPWEFNHTDLIHRIISGKSPIQIIKEGLHVKINAGDSVPLAFSKLNELAQSNVPIRKLTLSGLDLLELERLFGYIGGKIKGLKEIELRDCDNVEGIASFISQYSETLEFYNENGKQIRFPLGLADSSLDPHGGTRRLSAWNGSEFSINQKELESEDLEMLDLTFTQGINTEQLLKILLRAKNLRTLISIDRINLYELDLPQDFQALSLEELSITDLYNKGYVEIKVIAKLLERMRSLRAFSVEANLRGNEYQWKGKFPHLRKFRCKDFQFVTELINDCPELEELIMHTWSVPPPPYSCPSTQSNSLKKLCVSFEDSTIAINEASRLLNGCLNLETLNLDMLGLNHSFKLDPMALQQLRELKITITLTVDPSHLDSLISQAKNLIRLDIDIFAGIKTKPENSAPSTYACFKQLETLTIRSARKIGMKWLQEVLLNAKNLRNLTVSADLDSHFEVPEDLELNALTTLDISSGKFLDADQLYLFLERTPNLRVLRLHNRLDLVNLMIPPGLRKLEIIVSGEKVSPNAFENYPDAHKVRYKELSTEQEDHDPVKQSNSSQIPPPRSDLDHTQGLKTSWDADADPNTTPFSTVQFLFQNKSYQKVSPTLYRLETYKEVSLEPGVFHADHRSHPFRSIPYQKKLGPKENIRKHQTDLSEIFSQKNEQTDKAEYFHAKMNRKLDQEFRALPSLSPNEELVDISIRGLEPNDYELKYDEGSNLYYVKVNKPVDSLYELEYVLKVPVTLPEIDPRVIAIAKSYESQPETHLPSTDQKLTASEILKMMIAYKSGACRHRSIAFWKEIHDHAKAWGIALECRIISNDCHTYVEVRQNHSAWIRLDLGGFGATWDYLPDLFEVTPVSVAKAKTPIKVARPKKAPLRLNPAFVQEKEKVDATLPSFTFHLLNQLWGDNALVTFSNERALDYFQQYCRLLAKHEGRPLYYIDSAEDVQCHLKQIKRDQNNIITPVDQSNAEGSGPLYDFLTDSSILSQNPLIIINFDRFSAEELAAYNALIDKERRADGVKIPEKMRIIGLYNTAKPNAYQGQDFYSRFTKTTEFRFSENQVLEEIIKNLPSPISEDQQSVKHVYLHQAEEWETLLLGSYQISAGQLRFDPNIFINQLNANETLIIHDAPLQDRAFQKFLNRVLIDKKITIAGVEYIIPEGFNIQFGEPYVLAENLIQDLNIQMLDANTSLPEGVHVLNPSTFGNFYERYEFKDNYLNSLPGWLVELKRGETLRVYLSDPLRDSQWGRLIKEASDRGIKIEIVTHSSMRLPESLKTRILSDNYQKIASVSKCIHIIETADAKRSIADLRNVEPGLRVVDVSDLSTDEIFGSYFPNAAPAFSFTRKNGLLDDNKPFILTGRFSLELSQRLAAWASSPAAANKKVTLVTDQELASLKPLSEYHKEIAREIKNTNPLVETEKIGSNLLENRDQLIDTALSQSPLVLIEGQTGSGKTTYVLDHFQHRKDIRLFRDLKQIKEWLVQPETEKSNVLFIDEANISEEQKHEWTEFVSMLMNNPPFFIHENEYYPLTPKHKVIFAGNPQSYGGERHAARLFQKYDIARVEFKPLGREFMINEVLRPIIAHLPDFEAISASFMDAYEHVIKFSGGRPLISPRELAHMAHLKLIYPAAAAEDITATVIKSLLPDLYSAPSRLELKTPKPLKGYKVTKSRVELESRLNELLAIRDLKKSGKTKNGMGGMIIEGEPGTGKSEHVISQLVAQGFEENKSFFRLPVSAGFAEKKTILEKAYQAGAIVIIDEINSQPSMERFFNDALSGTLKVSGPVTPGFLMIGTQNPTSLAGRRELSFALQRRTVQCKLSRCPAHELVEILEEVHQVPKPMAIEIVKDFETANRQSSSPLPMRVLFKKYDEAGAYIAKNQSQSAPPTKSPLRFRSFAGPSAQSKPPEADQAKGPDLF